MLSTATLRHSYAPQYQWADSISTQTPEHTPALRSEIPLLTLRHLPSSQSPRDYGTLEGILLTSKKEFQTSPLARFRCRKTRPLLKKTAVKPEVQRPVRLLNDSDIRLRSEGKSCEKKVRRCKLLSPLSMIRRFKHARSIREDLESTECISVLGKAYRTPTAQVCRTMESPLHSSPPKSFRTMRKVVRPKPKSVSCSVDQQRDFICWPCPMFVRSRLQAQDSLVSEPA